MRARRAYRQSDLFLVRVWAEKSEGNADEVEWHGNVQRAVDGKSHRFRGEHDLLTQLAALLPGDGHAPSMDLIQEQAGQ